MIKENESHSKILNFEIFTPLSGNLKMLHFDVNPIIRYLLTEYMSAENNIKQRNLKSFFANILTIYATFDSFHVVDHVEYNNNCDITTLYYSNMRIVSCYFKPDGKCHEFCWMRQESATKRQPHW